MFKDERVGRENRKEEGGLEVFFESISLVCKGGRSRGKF